MGDRTGILVLDIDPRHGGDAWEREHLDQLPDTRIHQTKSGGRHHVMRHAPMCGTAPVISHRASFHMIADVCCDPEPT
jgi:hypothetical protein